MMKKRLNVNESFFCYSSWSLLFSSKYLSRVICALFQIGKIKIMTSALTKKLRKGIKEVEIVNDSTSKIMMIISNATFVFKSVIFFIVHSSKNII